MNTKALSLGVLAFACLQSASQATIVTGPGGRGVMVGGSSLIGPLDYSDTFTGTPDGSANPNRPYIPAIQPAAAYAVESIYGHAAVNFRSQSQGPGIGEFSFAKDSAGQIPGLSPYPGGSGAGSATGFTQTGGSVDYGIPYGLRTRYMVQIDAVATSDRIDITTGSVAGTIFQANSLTIFFRGDGSGNASLFDGGTDTPIRNGYPAFTTGLPDDGQWHNYGVLFDQTAKTVELFVDEQSKIVVDLTTFAGGIYQNFSNANVGVGSGLAGGEDRTWTDNFQVGAPVPEPGTVLMLGVGVAGLVLRRRRQLGE